MNHSDLEVISEERCQQRKLKDMFCAIANDNRREILADINYQGISADIVLVKFIGKNQSTTFSLMDSLDATQ